MTTAWAESLPAPRAIAPARPIRVLFALPGLHRVNRGAEVAFESVARSLARLPGFSVILVGSGGPRAGEAYEFRHAGMISRKWFRKIPGMPLLRHDYMCEELTFVPGLCRAYSPGEVDVTVTCSYPYTNWVLRARREGGRAPLHVYVTQNGDWPLRADHAEYRYFDCDGLVCTNPEYLEAHQNRWASTLIPNGVDPDIFKPGPAERERFGIPAGRPVILTVSALIATKRIIEGIHAVASLPDAFFMVAGDGPLRDEIDVVGKKVLGERFRRMTLDRGDMPALYRSCDVLLHMSQGEPSAVTYIEALANGLPVVAHDSPVSRWTFDGQACLVDTSDLEKVGAALRQALTMRTQAGSHARRALAVNRFSWNNIAQRYAEFFRGLIEKQSNVNGAVR